ncbi:MAG: hypothetical protein HAW63_05685 [Bdellovibrionaceae bacterium]|nr:hypothetical protein [Pseudobdellovibrionaceae bacterium]
MKSLMILLLLLSSCSFMNTKTGSISGKDVFGFSIPVKNNRAPSSREELVIGKVYKIAIPDAIFLKTKDNTVAQCKPVFGARVEFLALDKEGQALLDYTSLMKVPTADFCQDGFVTTSKFLLEKSIKLFKPSQRQFFGLEKEIQIIMKVPTNIVTTKSILDSKKIIKSGQVVRVNSKKALPLGVKGLIALKGKESNFIKGYLSRVKSSLRVGEFCSPKNSALKIVGFSKKGDKNTKNILVKVLNKKTGNIFKLIGQYISEKGGACPVDSHFFISEKELL